ncbi:MAG: hypothetical protein CO090_01830 [Acidobacteria bacterium CG_4_9_14_3_um_filter_49_7]|nr:MAG: hypothetical protein CO090_01830 [Acidobacteria bacterium CG_4_9_14_3_um_filter_49_7]
MDSSNRFGGFIAIGICILFLWVVIEFLFNQCSRFVWLPVFFLIGITLYTFSWLPASHYPHFSESSWTKWVFLELLRREGGWGVVSLPLLLFLAVRIWKTYPVAGRKLLFRFVLPILIVLAFTPMVFRLGMTRYYKATLKPRTDTMAQLVNDLEDSEFGFGTDKVILLSPYGYSYDLDKLLMPYDLSYIKEIGKKAEFKLTTLECLYLRAQLSTNPVLWNRAKLRNVEFIESRFVDRNTEQSGGLRDYWPTRFERYGRRNFVYVSRPLFSRNGKWAIMTISRSCGSLCAYTYCLFIHLDTNGIWRIRTKQLISMS